MDNLVVARQLLYAIQPAPTDPDAEAIANALAPGHPDAIFFLDNDSLRVLIRDTTPAFPTPNGKDTP